eukprot:1153933-Pelagomonas_calceolata.AAC.2
MQLTIHLLPIGPSWTSISPSEKHLWIASTPPATHTPAQDMLKASTKVHMQARRPRVLPPSYAAVAEAMVTAHPAAPHISRGRRPQRSTVHMPV